MVRAADQRVSDAERDEVVERLRIAGGEGRIGHDELDERVARALQAKTYRELHATVDDIPRVGGAVPSRRRTAAGWAISAVRNEPWLLVVALPVVALTLTLALAALTMWVVFAVCLLAFGHRPGAPLGGRRHAAIGYRRGGPRGQMRAGWR